MATWSLLISKSLNHNHEHHYASLSSFYYLNLTKQWPKRCQIKKGSSGSVTKILAELAHTTTFHFGWTFVNDRLIVWVEVVCPVLLTFSQDTKLWPAQPFNLSGPNALNINVNESPPADWFAVWLSALKSAIHSQPLWSRDFLSVLFQPDWSAVSCTATTSGRTWRCCGFPGGDWCVLWGVYTRLMHSHCLSVPVQLAVCAPAALPLLLSVCRCTCLCVSALGLRRLCGSLNLRY